MVPRATFATVLALMLVAGGRPADAQAPAQAPARSPAAAATPAAPPAPPLAPPRQDGGVPRPDRTTASYGDWVLRCDLSNGGERLCEVAQTIQDGRSQVLALLTARRGTPGGPITFMAQLGPNATVTEPARLVIEDQAVLNFAFRRCMPRGCFAEVQVPDAEASTVARRTDAARLDYRDAEGALISIPVSLRGLAPSLEALRRAEQG